MTQPGDGSAPPAEDEESGFPQIREIRLDAPIHWLARGLQDFRACAAGSLFYGFFFAAMGLGMTLVFEHAYQYTSGLTSGFLLLGPFLCMGLYELSRQRARGETPNFFASLVVWRRNAGNIGVFAMVLLVIFLVWARASLVVFALFYTDQMPNLSGFLNQILKAENLEFLIVYLCTGLLFATVVFGASLVAIPLMLDRDQDAITAMLASAVALGRNPGPCLVWGLLIVGLVALGFASFHAGLVVVIPIIGHATWHSYQDLVAPLKPVRE